MKILIIILFQIIIRISRQASNSYCTQTPNTMYYCKYKNANNSVDDSLVYQRPIFSGKCCWRTSNGTQGYGKCVYNEESDVNGKIKVYLVLLELKNV